MNKRNIFYVGIIYSLMIFLILISTYINTEYNLTLFEYMKKSAPITEYEKKYLQEHGKIIYGSDQHSPPLRYVDTNDNQYSGIVVDLINSLSLEIGKEIIFKPTKWWQESLDNLNESNIDMFDLIISENRQSQFLFTDPIYTLRGNILKNKNENINTYKDLSNKTVAILEGDYAIDFISKNVDNVDIVKVLDIKHGIDYLINDKVDAVVGDDPVLYYYIQLLGLENNYEKLDTPIYNEKVGLALTDEDVELVNILNKAIFQLQRKGINDQIKSKWSFHTEDIESIFVDSKTSRGFEYIFLGIIFIFIYIFFSYSYILKYEISLKKYELEKSNMKLQCTYNQMLLDNKLAAIGQLASGVAHEIRNPLGIIRNYCYLIKEDNDIDDIRDSIIHIENNLDRANNIIHNLLNLSRLSNNKKTLLNLEKVINNIVSLEKKDLELKNISIEVISKRDVLCLLNEESLNHIFLNLISNSIDAIKTNGCIKIAIDLKEEGIIILFEDNGEGIKNEDIDSIFDPFFTNKDVGEGTGLGLYIVYNEIKNQGGDISVSSKINEGTIFKIILPYQGGKSQSEDISCG